MKSKDVNLDHESAWDTIQKDLPAFMREIGNLLKDGESR